MSHYGLRAEGDMPETAVWRNTSGYEQKRIYTYDEYDFYLTEVLEQVKVGGNWVNDELVNYDYGFDGEVLEVYDKAWFEEQWYEIGWATYTYNQNEMEVVYRFREIGEDWQNYLKEVYNYNDDVTTILLWIWNGTTWSSSVILHPNTVLPIKHLSDFIIGRTKHIKTITHFSFIHPCIILPIFNENFRYMPVKIKRISLLLVVLPSTTLHVLLQNIDRSSAINVCVKFRRGPSGTIPNP